MKKINKKVIMFDGICILCNGAVNFLIRLDKQKVLHYSSLQGEFIKSLEIEPNFDSIIFYDEGKCYYKSTAILKILQSLGEGWFFVNVFYVIPLFVRDAIYDLIAKYRYKIFGKMDSCRVPQEGEIERFLD